ncbi:MAG: hypothetical protein IKQ80_04940, partial [Clostridia bacterium]|nr:hypothetical protein [Clostridia bacterium]
MAAPTHAMRVLRQSPTRDFAFASAKTTLDTQHLLWYAVVNDQKGGLSVTEIMRFHVRIICGEFSRIVANHRIA